MSEKDMIRKDYMTNCDQRDNVKTEFFNFVAPARFYLKYGKREKAYWKH